MLTEPRIGTGARNSSPFMGRWGPGVPVGPGRLRGRASNSSPVHGEMERWESPSGPGPLRGPGPPSPASGEGKLACRCLGWWDQALDHVLLLQQLLRGYPDSLPRIVVVVQVWHDLPVVSVRPHREAELQPVWHSVLPVADHPERMPVTPRSRLADAHDRIDDRVGGRCGRGRASGLDHRGATLLDRLHELALQ